jgi:hypothetical protein
MTNTMIERCQLIKLTSEAFEALRADIAKPALPGAAIVTMEPWLAQRLLETPHRNRPRKPRLQRQIIAALRGDYWYLNGEPILLNETMDLLDGENRCHSCIEAKIAMDTVISWGWPQEGFVTIDTGIKRSGGDTLSAAGEANAYALSAAARYDWRLQTKNMVTDEQMPAALIEDYIHAHEGLKASLSWGDIASKMIPKGLAVALHYRLSMQDAALAKQFFLEIARGEDINRHDTTYWLREVLARYRRPHLHTGRIQQAHIAAHVLKGWHAVRAGRLRMGAELLWHDEKNEPFPEVEYAEKQNQPRARK